MGCVAAGEDGARLGKGGGFADLEFALASAAGLIGPHTVTVTTVHEVQLRPAGVIPLTEHDIALDFIVTPEGRHVFLEVNPSGEFLWLMQRPGLPIADALADVLVGRAPRRFEPPPLTGAADAGGSAWR